MAFASISVHPRLRINRRTNHRSRLPLLIIGTKTFACLAALSLGQPVRASEVITYVYDARGRLIQVAHAGSVNDGAAACYSYDDAGNRANVTTATNGGPDAVSFSVNNDSAIEGGTLAFSVTKSGSAAGLAIVRYETVSLTAASGTDYTPLEGELSFGPAETSKSVSVATIDDSAFEGAETVGLKLSASGCATGWGTGIGTITDNETAPPPPSFSINNASAFEGSPVVFTVTKSGSTSSTMTVNYTTANGSASTGDYASSSGTLTFGPSDTSETISVTTIGDTRNEAEDETFYVNLSAASGGATISDGQGQGTIIEVFAGLMSDSSEGEIIQEAPATDSGTDGDETAPPPDPAAPE